MLKPLIRHLVTLLLIASVGAASAQRQQPAELPDDMAYVRVLVSADKTFPDGAVDIAIDGKIHIRNQGLGEVSPYFFLRAGQRSLAVHKAGQGNALLSVPLDIIAGTTATVALAGVYRGVSPQWFMDSPPPGRQQARLTVYHVDLQGERIDILTVNGARLLSSIPPGASATLQVNPIKVELLAVRPGGRHGLARREVDMTAGGGHSLFFLPDIGKNLRLSAGPDRFDPRPVP